MNREKMFFEREDLPGTSFNKIGYICHQQRCTTDRYYYSMIQKTQSLELKNKQKTWTGIRHTNSVIHLILDFLNFTWG